jgi:hypothetical protein
MPTSGGTSTSTTKTKSNKAKQAHSTPPLPPSNKAKKLSNTPSAALSVTPTLVVQPIPPLFEAIPCKPIVYDIASNYLDSLVNDAIDTRCGVKRPVRVGPGQGERGGGAGGVNGSPGGSGVEGGGLVGTATSWFGWWSGGGGK